MLYFIVAWMILASAAYCIGVGVLNYFNGQAFARVGDRCIAAVWLGVISLAVGLLATSTALPLSPLIGATVAGLLCLVSLCARQTRLDLNALYERCSWRRLGTVFAIAIAVAAFMTQPVIWGDTGLYHYGTIQWLAKFGTVPGLALLFSNFGFTSSWFALAAPLNPEILDARVSAVTNGFVFFLAVLQLVICLAHTLKRQALPSDYFMLVFLLVMLPLFSIRGAVDSMWQQQPSVILISPSPDIPITFLIGVISWAILAVANDRSTTTSPHPGLNSHPASIPLMLAAGAVTIKLIAIPLLLLSSVFYLVQCRGNARKLLLGAAIVSVVLTPLLVAGTMTSGCPLYPSSAVCFDLPWSVSATVAQQAATGTHDWTAWYGSPPPEQTGWLWLLWRWFTARTSNQVVALLAIVDVLSIVTCRKLLKTCAVRGARWVLAIAGLGFLFLTTTSPFLRFTLPYLILIPVLLISIWGYRQFHDFSCINPRLNRLNLLKNTDSLLLLSSAFLAAIVCTIFLAKTSTMQLLLPPRLQAAEVIQKQVNDITYFAPNAEGELCWATPLPCAYGVSSDVHLRDPEQGLRAGFVRMKG